MSLQQNGTFYPIHKDYYINANRGTLLLTCLAPFWHPKHYHLKQSFSLPRHIFKVHMGAIGVPPQVFYCIPSSNRWRNRGRQQSLGSCSLNSLWSQKTMGQLLAHSTTQPQQGNTLFYMLFTFLSLLRIPTNTSNRAPTHLVSSRYLPSTTGTNFISTISPTNFTMPQ